MAGAAIKANAIMNSDFKLKHILVFALGLSTCTTLAHDVPVHWAITINAAASAFKDSPAYASFLNTVSSDCDLATATNFMVVGSGLEDAPVPGIALDAGKYRSFVKARAVSETIEMVSDEPPVLSPDFRLRLMSV